MLFRSAVNGKLVAGRSFCGETRLASIISVVSGNGLVVAMRLTAGEPLARYRVQVAGIHAPAIHSRDRSEQLAAEVSRDALEEVVPPGALVHLVLHGTNAEGYELATASTVQEVGTRTYVAAHNIADRMVERGFAKPWSGKGPAPTWHATELQVIRLRKKPSKEAELRT